MAWVKSANVHVADNVAIEGLSPSVAFAFIRTGLVVGIVAGLVVGWWHRNDFSPNQGLYDHVQEARDRGAALREQQCREFPNSAICKPKGDKK